MGDAITITGLEDLSQMLTELTPKAAKRYLSQCAKPAAQVVLTALAETVPVRVGVLEEMLGWQKHWGTDGDQTTMEIEIGPLKPAFWGSLQEFGTVTVPAQHWMGRAWEGCREEVLDVFVRGVNDLIARLIARDMSEAIAENDSMDRMSGTPSAARVARDRKAAYRENNRRNKKG